MTQNINFLLYGLSVCIFCSVLAAPQHPNLEKSISSVLESLTEEDNSPTRIRNDIRSKIITKYDFMNRRNPKTSQVNLPEEFVIRTNLQVSNDNFGQGSENYRSGRSNQIFSNHRKARQGFADLATAVKNAPVVTGIRVPDDETDTVVHRGGRFINNMYVPDERVPDEVVVTAELSPSYIVTDSRDQHVRSARSYQSSSDVYYNTNEYTFTPLQHYEQQQQQQQQSAVFPAERDDFVIEMQTYKQCENCPEFTVPVPIPKFQEPILTERKEEKSLIAKLADIVRPAISRARQFLSGDKHVDTASSRIDSPQPENKITAPIMASLTAIGVGLASYFGTNLAGSGRKFEDNSEYVEMLNTIDDELQTLSNYTDDDVLCLPRRYCDNLKRETKFLEQLNQYPNMKKVAAWMTEAYFENIGDQDYSHSQCNIKQCLKDLLN